MKRYSQTDQNGVGIINDDATGSSKGQILLTNDLGGTATSPTTPTAVHLAGTETITGVKTFNLAPIVPSNSFPESAITNLISDLAAKAADSLVVHLSGTETITGAKTFNAGTFLDKGNQVFNVMAYGAVGDGTTDDTVAIRAAITAATTGGGSIYIPPGYTFAISNYLALPSNVWLIGAGETSIIKQIAGSNVNAIIRGTGQISHSGLDSLLIDYNHQNNTSCSQGMSFGSQSSYITVRNCHFKNAKGFAISFTGQPATRNDHIYVYNNLITDILSTPNDMLLVVSDYGIVVNNRVIGSTANISIVLFESDHLYAAGNIVELGSSNLGQSGISCLSLLYSTVIGNKVLGSGTGYGMRLITEHDNASPITSAYNLITNNFFDNLNTGMSIDETNYDLVQGNKFRTMEFGIEFPLSGRPSPTNLLVQRNDFSDITFVVNNGTSLTAAQLGAIFRDNNGYASQGDSAILNAANLYTANQTIQGNIPYWALKTTQSGNQEWRWVSAYNDPASITLLDATNTIQVLIISNSTLTPKDGLNIALGTTTGTKFGTATSQKLAFYNSTPIVKPSGDILTALSNLGLVSSPTLSESDITNLTTDLAAKSSKAFAIAMGIALG